MEESWLLRRVGGKNLRMNRGLLFGVLGQEFLDERSLKDEMEENFLKSSR